ncbi:hypothetical protein HDU91_001044, partial [Kappamyces sp. JEL0680]
RIIACLDVRSNDHGDLVVTKGDQYDVREHSGEVRNLGKPVELARRYYEEGADEVTFLNITSFRDCPLEDTPMLEVLKKASETVFVPLTIGGGIRDMTQPDGRIISALDVAGEYFRSGADKVSIGSDAVYIAEEYTRGNKSTKNAISMISYVYGAQAVVISVDPKRVYVSSPADTTHTTTATARPGPNGEKYCWYQCTVKGGREARDLDVVQLTSACEALGAGEILLNCMDHDGMNQGYDLELIAMVKKAVRIPVIASSGAGAPEHFDEVFRATNAEAALAAGIFHRREVAIEAVKKYLQENVSFDSLHEKLLFEEDEPASQVLGYETRPISTDNSTKSILKAPLLHVVPTDLPMKPEDYESDGVVRVMGGVDSESSDDDLGFYSSDEEEGQDEDIDFDDDTYAGDSVFFDDDDASEPESVFEQATLEDFQNITGLQEKLDNYMERHPKQAALVNSTLLNYKRNGSRSNERLDAVPDYADLPFLGVPSERQLAAQPASPIVHNPGTKQDAAATPVFTYFGQGIGPLPVSSKTATPLSQSMPTPQNVKSPEDSSDEEDNIPIMQLISPSQHVPVPEKQPAIDATQQIMAKLSEANIRKITTRVYIENSKKYLTKVLTSLMTAGQLVQEVALASDEARWALFELCIDYGIERPLREWEIVTDVLSAWNHSSANAIVVKPYKY